jgi:Conjugative transposon protein TcpC
MTVEDRELVEEQEEQEERLGDPGDDGQLDRAPEGGDLRTEVWEDELVDDAPDDAGADVIPPPGPNALSRRYVVGSVLLARLATGGLWLLVIAGVVMAALALTVRSAPVSPDQAAPSNAAVPAADEAVLVAGFAQMAVRHYLGEAGQDTESVMTPFLGDAPDLRGVTPQGFYVVDTVAVEVNERGDGYWSATVAADLMASVDEQYQPVGVRYYDVGVLVGDEETGGPVLADLPSQVPAPATAERPALLSGDLSPAADDIPQAAAVREFLNALLLGQGSIQRYTAPGTTIAAISPPPFTSLELDQVAIQDPEADQTVVRASVLAVDDHGLAQRLNYTVDLRLRDGRWEIAELFDAPPLAEETAMSAAETN